MITCFKASDQIEEQMKKLKRRASPRLEEGEDLYCEYTKNAL